MKKTLAIVSLFLCFLVSAQVPQGINYQAIVRDGSGNPITSGTVTVDFIVNFGSSSIFQEQHVNVPVSEYGLVNLVIGTGTPINKTFADVTWENSALPITVEVQVDGVSMGPAQPLQSVPYALHAQTADALTTSSPIITASNGLTKVSDDIQLGGTLDASVTQINVNNNIFELAQADELYFEANILEIKDNSGDAYVFFSGGGRSIGIGSNTTPGAFRYRDGNEALNRVLTTDASGNASWQDLPSGLWAESGSDIYYTSGNVGIGVNAPASLLNVDGGAVLFSGTVGVTPVSGAGTRLMWIPQKAALRAGVVNGTQWDDTNVGTGSAAFGAHTLVSGNYSAAFGTSNTVSGSNSFAAGSNHTVSQFNSAAFGQNNTASGARSFAAGISSEAVGNGSSAIGESAHAGGRAEFSVGAYPDNSGSAAAFTTMFEVGNGTSAAARNTAFLVNYAGEVGVGTTTPSSRLHVDGGSVLATGTTGATPISGAGSRMMWVPEKSAFRAGRVQGTQWDDANIGNYSTALGFDNIASSTSSGAFGNGNIASGLGAHAIGLSNEANGSGAMAIGNSNRAISNQSFAFGFQNEASGVFSLAMGFGSTASGDYSVALGRSVNSTADGSFSIRDATTGVFNNGTANRFMALFSNGYILYSNASFSTGARLNAGASSWSVISDSTQKENFHKVNTDQLLEGLSSIRLGTWNYIANEDNVRHYGPMAQDFDRVFGHDSFGHIGDDTSITTQDISGVNMTLIQALAEKAKNYEDLLKQQKKMLLENKQQIEQLKEELNNLRRN